MSAMKDRLYGTPSQALHTLRDTPYHQQFPKPDLATVTNSNLLHQYESIPSGRMCIFKN